MQYFKYVRKFVEMNTKVLDVLASDKLTTLISELTELLIKSRDPEELRHVWIEWRRKTGEQVRDLYQQYVDLSNKAARLNSKPKMLSKNCNLFVTC